MTFYVGETIPIQLTLTQNNQYVNASKIEIDYYINNSLKASSLQMINTSTGHYIYYLDVAEAGVYDFVFKIYDSADHIQIVKSSIYVHDTINAY